MYATNTTSPRKATEYGALEDGFPEWKAAGLTVVQTTQK